MVRSGDELQGRLRLRTGRPEEVVPEVARELAATGVHISSDHGPYGRARDERVARALGDVPLVATGSPYAVASGQLLRAYGSPYRVYSPYARAWAARGVHSPAAAPRRLPWTDGGLPGEDVPADPTSAACACPVPGSRRRTSGGGSVGTRVVAHEGLVLANTADVHAAAAQARADAAHALATRGNAAAGAAQTRADEALALAGKRAVIVAHSSTNTGTAEFDVEAFCGFGLIAPLKPSHLYLLAAWGFEVQTVTGDTATMRLRHTTDGTAVTLTSPSIKDRQYYPTRDAFARDTEFFHLYRSPSTAVTLKAQMTLLPRNGATGAKLFTGRRAVIVLIDLGTNLSETP